MRHCCPRRVPLTIFAALFILQVNFETHAFYAHTLDLRILKAQAIEKPLSRLRTVFRWRLTWSRRSQRRRISIRLLHHHAGYRSNRRIPHDAYAVSSIPPIFHIASDLYTWNRRHVEAVATARAKRVPIRIAKCAVLPISLLCDVGELYIRPAGVNCGFNVNRPECLASGCASFAERRHGPELISAFNLRQVFEPVVIDAIRFHGA